jgi:hydroxymethylbilane synthase
MAHGDTSRLIRLGTRSSPLAMAQSGHVARDLETATGLTSELIPIRVEGDDHTMAMDGASRPGIFASALRDALVSGEVDYIVHSYKDLPSTPMNGADLVAVPPRVNPRDVLAGTSLTLDELAKGAKIGTSSPRRASALKRLRNDLEIVPIRGNVDTRLRKVATGEVDAVIMAYAGLERLGVLDESWQVFDPDQMLPAPAQGALAIECGMADQELRSALATLDHGPTLLETIAERMVLCGVEATCTTAIGALATWEGRTLTLTAELSDHLYVGYARVTQALEIPDVPGDSEMLAASLGNHVARQLLGQEEGKK